MFCLGEDDDCHFGGEESWDGALPGCLLVDPEADAGFIYNVRSIARQNVGLFVVFLCNCLSLAFGFCLRKRGTLTVGAANAISLTSGFPWPTNGRSGAGGGLRLAEKDC